MAKNNIVDCRGLACPMPVLETKKALANAESALVVIVDNEASCTNVSRFAESQGARVSVDEKNDEFHLTIVPDQKAPSEETARIDCETTNPENMVVLVSSETMGRGDDELGAILMEAFLDTLSQFKDQLSHAIFVNAGAKLAVEGSPVLEQIQQLEEVGVEVLVCGTCLNFFEIADKLAVGSVTNMFAIIETLSGAGRVIRP